MSIAQIEKFRAREMNAAEMTRLAAHLSECEECRRLFQQSAARQMESSTSAINLSPQFWFKDDHLEYEELIDVVDGRLDSKESQIINLHLATCETCRDDLRSFREFVHQVEHELKVGDRIEEQPELSWWKLTALNWKWRYAAAALAAVGAIVFSTIIWIRLRTSQFPNVIPSPTPSIIASASPQPSAAVSISQIPNPSSVVHGTLEDETMVTAELKRPEALNELFVGLSQQRGLNTDPAPFKLLSPARAVIEDDRPTFRWERLEGATNYQVQFVASGSREFTSSDTLPAETTQWRPAAPLKRGVVYKWMVTATVNGEDVSSPAVNAPEMRFMALSEQQLRELRSLRKSTTSQLALGAFYARAGMLAEAEREFKAYRNDNPQFPLAEKLIRQVQSWR